MILDRLENLKKYAELHRRFGEVVSFIDRADLSNLADGRYEIDGTNIFMTIGTFALKTSDEAIPEAHDEYIDIQVVVAGEENYGWLARGECVSPRAEMDKEKDIIFFDDRPSTMFTARAGEFCVFFPEDCHAPLVGAGEVRKCVFKIRKQII